MSVGAMGPIELAGYARGVQDAAADNGWRLAMPTDPARPDWVLLRLLATCSLASHASKKSCSVDVEGLPAI
jgi:hypothetical protein